MELLHPAELVQKLLRQRHRILVAVAVQLDEDRLRATTPKGLRAKARAILALEEAATWSGGRDDMMDMLLSLLRNAAGADGVGMGDGTVPRGTCAAPSGCTVVIEWEP